MRVCEKVTHTDPKKHQELNPIRKHQNSAPVSTAAAVTTLPTSIAARIALPTVRFHTLHRVNIQISTQAHNIIMHNNNRDFIPPNYRAPSPRGCCACRYQRRACPPSCVFRPYFTTDQPSQDFLNVHRLYGVERIRKILTNINPMFRDDFITSIITEANCHAIDPVGGCTNFIRSLHEKIINCTMELKIVQRHLAHYRAAANQQLDATRYRQSCINQPEMGNLVAQQQQLPLLDAARYRQSSVIQPEMGNLAAQQQQQQWNGQSSVIQSELEMGNLAAQQQQQRYGQSSVIQPEMGNLAAQQQQLPLPDATRYGQSSIQPEMGNLATQQQQQWYGQSSIIQSEMDNLTAQQQQLPLLDTARYGQSSVIQSEMGNLEAQQQHQWYGQSSVIQPEMGNLATQQQQLPLLDAAGYGQSSVIQPEMGNLAWML